MNSPTSNEEKTLGQINCEAFYGAPEDAMWGALSPAGRRAYEAAAQAVRAAVIEEITAEMDRMANTDLYASREWQIAEDKVGA
jgi:hypothetical protein